MATTKEVEIAGMPWADRDEFMEPPYEAEEKQLELFPSAPTVEETLAHMKAEAEANAASGQIVGTGDLGKLDDGKLQMRLIPSVALRALAKVFTLGAIKYTPFGWKGTTRGVERYHDALGRHYAASLDDPFAIDEEMHLPHLALILSNAAILLWFGERDARIKTIK